MTRQEILGLIEGMIRDKFDADAMLKFFEDAEIIWTPENNTTQLEHLTYDQQSALKAAKHDWEYWHRDFEEWTETDDPSWHPKMIYRAKPAPEVKSTWEHVYITPDSRPYTHGWFTDLEQAKSATARDSIGIIRLDLIDGKLSVEVEE